MNREWLLPLKLLTGMCTLAGCSFSQSYTVSAKPGAVNFIEGAVTVNGDPVWTSNLKSTFLNAGDTISVNNGKAEVLLTPGVFLRLGEHSQVRMVKPSLIETQVEVISGESMVEVDDVVPGSSVVVLDHGSSTQLVKAGLYRFNEHSIATLDGKAQVVFGARKVDLKKNKEVQIDDALRASKLDLSQGDDLYAWSNSRSQYAAAATYAGARDVYNAGGYGFSSYNSPGWYWSQGFSSYMWMPGNGAFYSPFGWGFYGPGVVAYAPVIVYPYGGYGGYGGGRWHPQPVAGSGGTATAVNTAPGRITVPVNPNSPGVAAFRGPSSPAAFMGARNQMQRAVSNSGLRTANGAPAAAMRNGQTFSSMQSASHAAASNAHAHAAPAGGGWNGGGAGNTGGARSSAPVPMSAPRAGGPSHK